MLVLFFSIVMYSYATNYTHCHVRIVLKKFCAFTTVPFLIPTFDKKVFRLVQMAASADDFRLWYNEISEELNSSVLNARTKSNNLVFFLLS